MKQPPQHAETVLYSFQDGRCRTLLIPACPCHPLVKETGSKAKMALDGLEATMREIERQMLARSKANVKAKLFGPPSLPL